MGFTTIVPEPQWEPITPNINPEDWDDDDE